MQKGQIYINGFARMKGLKMNLICFSAVTATPGPLAKDVDSLVLAMRAVLCPHMFQLDPEVPPIPFRSEVSIVLFYNCKNLFCLQLVDGLYMYAFSDIGSVNFASSSMD